MSASGPEERQRFYTELIVIIFRKNLCKSNLRNSSNLIIWTVPVNKLSANGYKKTDKLPQTPANQTNPVFSERLPRITKSSSPPNIYQRFFRSCFKVRCNFLFETPLTGKAPENAPTTLSLLQYLKTPWKADRGRIRQKNFKLPTSFELGMKQCFGYKMNLEKNSNTCPVSARERGCTRKHTHTHTQHVYIHNKFTSPMHKSICTNKHRNCPIHIKTIKPFARYYQNSLNKIPRSGQHQQEARSTVTGAKGVSELQAEKENVESNQTGR